MMLIISEDGLKKTLCFHFLQEEIMKIKCSKRKGGYWCPIKKARCTGDLCDVAVKREKRRNRLNEDMLNMEKILGISQEAR